MWVIRDNQDRYIYQGAHLFQPTFFISCYLSDILVDGLHKQWKEALQLQYMKIRIHVSKKRWNSRIRHMKKRPNFELSSKGLEQGSLWKDGKKTLWMKAGKVHLGSIRKGSKCQSKEFWLSPGHKEEELQIFEQKNERRSTRHRPLPGTHSQVQQLSKMACLHNLEADDTVGKVSMVSLSFIG